MHPELSKALGLIEAYVWPAIAANYAGYTGGKPGWNRSTGDPQPSGQLGGLYALGVLTAEDAQRRMTGLMTEADITSARQLVFELAKLVARSGYGVGPAEAILSADEPDAGVVTEEFRPTYHEPGAGVVIAAKGAKYPYGA